MNQNQESENFQLRNWELVSVNPNNRNWVWTDYFNFWAISIQSVIGFSLIASLYLLYDLNSIIVLSGSLIATLLISILSNIIGKMTSSSISIIRGITISQLCVLLIRLNVLKY